MTQALRWVKKGREGVQISVMGENTDALTASQGSAARQRDPADKKLFLASWKEKFIYSVLCHSERAVAEGSQCIKSLLTINNGWRRRQWQIQNMHPCTPVPFTHTHTHCTMCSKQDTVITGGAVTFTQSHRNSNVLIKCSIEPWIPSQKCIPNQTKTDPIPHMSRACMLTVMRSLNTSLAWLCDKKIT